MKKREVKKETKKTLVQEFFEQVKIHDTGADWDAVESVFKRKDDIANEVARDILSLIAEIKDDFGTLVRKEVFLGVTPEEPNPEVELATQHVKFTFLRELERIGLVKDLREIKKEKFIEGSQWFEYYAAISFYSSVLKDHLSRHRMTVGFSGEKVSVSFDVNLSKLIVGNKQISIKRLSDQYHLLRVILGSEDKKSIWFFSEIGEILDQYKKVGNDKRYYNATYQIKKKLEVVGSDDLFKTTNQSIEINEQYLITS